MGLVNILFHLIQLFAKMSNVHVIIRGNLHFLLTIATCYNLIGCNIIKSTAEYHID